MRRDDSSVDPNITSKFLLSRCQQLPTWAGQLTHSPFACREKTLRYFLAVQVGEGCLNLLLQKGKGGRLPLLATSGVLRSRHLQAHLMQVCHLLGLVFRVASTESVWKQGSFALSQ
jgi:hypothetical protein